MIWSDQTSSSPPTTYLGCSEDTTRSQRLAGQSDPRTTRFTTAGREGHHEVWMLEGFAKAGQHRSLRGAGIGESPPQTLLFLVDLITFFNRFALGIEAPYSHPQGFAVPAHN